MHELLCDVNSRGIKNGIGYLRISRGFLERGSRWVLDSGSRKSRNRFGVRKERVSAISIPSHVLCHHATISAPPRHATRLTHLASPLHGGGGVPSRPGPGAFRMPRSQCRDTSVPRGGALSLYSLYCLLVMMMCSRTTSCSCKSTVVRTRLKCTRPQKTSPQKFLQS